MLICVVCVDINNIDIGKVNVSSSIKVIFIIGILKGGNFNIYIFIDIIKEDLAIIVSFSI